MMFEIARNIFFKSDAYAKFIEEECRDIGSNSLEPLFNQNDLEIQENESIIVKREYSYYPKDIKVRTDFRS